VTVPFGVPIPIVVTLQAVIEDVTTASTFAVTNGFILRVN
jgi:hypothetical protein